MNFTDKTIGSLESRNSSFEGSLKEDVHKRRQESDTLPRDRSRRRLMVFVGIGGVIIVLVIMAVVFFKVAGDDVFANPYHKKEVTVDLGGGVRLEMVYLQSGSFQMRSPYGKSRRKDGEGPVHRVELDGFWIGKFQVTQAQYRTVMGTNPSGFKGDNRPVEMVSWDDAMEFCRKLSQKTGKTFTLPTEVQWEYACRAGTSTRYYFGDDGTLLGEYAWYSKNSNRETHPVGQKKPNAWGLYDMHGNVMEWCLDWFDDDYYSQSLRRNPAGTNTGSYRVYRGGNWNYAPDYSRSAYRNGGLPGIRGTILGFRLAAPSRSSHHRLTTH